jgi:hypothetical protein
VAAFAAGAVVLVRFPFSDLPDLRANRNAAGVPTKTFGLGFLRLAANKTAMAGKPLTVPQAWQAYVAFRRLPDVILVDEP